MFAGIWLVTKIKSQRSLQYFIKKLAETILLFYCYSKSFFKLICYWHYTIKKMIKNNQELKCFCIPKSEWGNSKSWLVCCHFAVDGFLSFQLNFTPNMWLKYAPFGEHLKLNDCVCMFMGERGSKKTIRAYTQYRWLTVKKDIQCREKTNV